MVDFSGNNVLSTIAVELKQGGGGYFLDASDFKVKYPGDNGKNGAKYVKISADADFSYSHDSNDQHLLKNRGYSSFAVKNTKNTSPSVSLENCSR